MAGHSAFGTLLGVATSMSVLDLTTRPKSTEWNDIGALTNIGGPSISVDTIDVSAHDSADGYREFVAGLIEGGDISLEGNFASTEGVEILDLLDTRALVSFRVQFTTTGASTQVVNYDTWLFAGSMVGFETDSPFDGKIGFSAGVKLSGRPFLTSTYSSS